MTAETQTKQESRFHVFFSHAKSMQTVTGDGRKIVFVSGKYYTKHAGEIEFLKSMVEENRGIYIDPNLLTVSEADRDPVQALKNKIRQEILAEMAAQVNPQNDRGESVQGRLNAASTQDVAAVAAGGDATQLHQQVAKLIPGKTK